MNGNADGINKMAIECFKKLALDEFINHYDPEYDEPRYTSTVSEICDLVYHQGVNLKMTAVGPKMRMLYVPDGLRFQGKGALEEHVKMAVKLAFIDWISETNDLGFLEGINDAKEVGVAVDQWEVA